MMRSDIGILMKKVFQMEVVIEGLTNRNYLELKVQNNIPASLQLSFLCGNETFAIDTAQEISDETPT
eukprot:1107126-Amphidinium_carterae.1